ncbi:27254_t:CDS:2, partial [Racocetra persica]
MITQGRNILLLIDNCSVHKLLANAFKLTEKSWESVTEKTIKNCWKSTGILSNFFSDGTSTFLSAVPTTNISTNSSTISNVSTNSTRESSPINYKNTTTTVFHNSIIATNNEGITTLHKSSTTNIDNMTTMIQNNIITINQYSIITSVQD